MQMPVRATCPPGRPEPPEVAARSILFADRDMTVNADLGAVQGVLLPIFPGRGRFLKKGRQLSACTAGVPTRDDALALLDKHISTVRQYMR